MRVFLIHIFYFHTERFVFYGRLTANGFHWENRKEQTANIMISRYYLVDLLSPPDHCKFYSNTYLFPILFSRLSVLGYTKKSFVKYYLQKKTKTINNLYLYILHSFFCVVLLAKTTIPTVFPARHYTSVGKRIFSF